ncbi:MotA/TolQ/ExbB proton channel family protein [Halobacillus litoralis]|uniref:MotA/TolQ/ExbB proton channel family protein n=1 Tax=Halobacillus litoralis TaxID=45668 RepID=UPI001CD5BB8A|nr:MotA/TolQ/ExbB proton channel family protein [Halobacillus litoralis]MCA0971358.1 MotA/TolQ/ExbB proton channel family protein [Halobacillus litoralis]
MKWNSKFIGLYILISAVVLFLFLFMKGAFDDGSNITSELVPVGVNVVTFLVLIFVTLFAVGRNKEMHGYLRQYSDPRSWEFKDVQDKIQQSLTNHQNEKVELSRDHVQTVIENYFAHFRIADKYNAARELKLIQALGSITILIGVLGTFVGLVFSLRGINTEEIQSSIAPILSGIDTAFYTSIAGILCSMVINLHTKFKNTDQLFLNIMLTVENEILADKDNFATSKVVEAIGEVGDEIKGLKKSFEGIQTFSKDFEAASENLVRFNDDFGQSTGKLNDTFKNMQDIMEAFNQSSDKIHHDFEHLLEYLQHQDTFQQQLVSSIETSNDRLHSSMDRNEEFMTCQIEGVQHLHEQHHNFMSQFMDHFDSMCVKIDESMNQSLEDTKDAYESMSAFQNSILSEQKSIVETQIEFEKKNTLLLEQVSQATSSIQDVLDHTSFDGLSEVASQLKEQTDRLSTTFASTMQGLEHVQRGSDESVTLLNKISEEFTAQAQRQAENQSDLEDNMKTYLDKNEQIYHSFEEAIGIFKQQGKNQDDLSDLAVKMEQQFEDNYRKITDQTVSLNASMGEFMDKSTKQMETFIRQTEESMNNNLSKSIQELERYVKNTNKILDNRFFTMESKMILNDEVVRTVLEDLHQSIDSLNENVRNMKQQKESFVVEG